MWPYAMPLCYGLEAALRAAAEPARQADEEKHWAALRRAAGGFAEGARTAVERDHLSVAKQLCVVFTQVRAEAATLLLWGLASC